MARPALTPLITVLCSMWFGLAPASASAQFLHTFTPDPPPIGDDIDYPRTINPARQHPGGGVAPDFFDTEEGTIFMNTNGNPAFFDGNNLLTRPAQRITNEAFWTDPKIGVFDTGLGFDDENASFGFQFSPQVGEEFGFDLAIGSVSDPVPEILPFFIQNTNSPMPDFGVFELGLTIGSGDISPTEAGTFTTLGSPFPGREARFRIPHAQIEALLGNGSPLQIFSINLLDISTLGGSTQIALDNFVLAGASALPNEPQREPVRFQSELLPPTSLQYFLLDSLASQETGIEIDLGGLPFESVIALAAITQAPPGSALPELETNVLAGFDELVGELSVGLSSPGDVLPGSVPVWVPPTVAPLGAGVEVDFEARDQSLHLLLTESYLSSAAAISEQVIETQLDLFQMQVALQNQQQLLDLISASLESSHAMALNLVSNLRSRAPRGGSPTFTLYVDYSADQYLALKRAAGLEPVVGDTGSDLTPITDDDGQIVDFLVQTWIVADGPGEYAPIVLVPEPGAAGMLAIGGLVFGAAARRRRAD